MCSRRLFAPLALLLLLTSGAVAGEMIHGLPLHSSRPSENCLRLWVGDYISSTAVCALNTDRGIVTVLDRRIISKGRTLQSRSAGRTTWCRLCNYDALRII